MALGIKNIIDDIESFNTEEKKRININTKKLVRKKTQEISLISKKSKNLRLKEKKQITLDQQKANLLLNRIQNGLY